MKKGFFLLGDMTWFLLFVVFAVLIFLFGFKPLHDRISNSVDTATTNPDGQYLALGLSRTVVHSQGAVLQGLTPSYDGKPFTSLVQALVHEYNNPPTQTAPPVTGATPADATNQRQQYTFETSRVYTDYVQALHAVFDDPHIWAITAKQKNYPVLYAVVVRQGNTYLQSTCQEFSGGARKYLCSQVDYSRGSNTDPATGLSVPMFNGIAASVSTNPVSERDIDIGTVYIPSEEGTIILQVVVGYSGGS